MFIDIDLAERHVHALEPVSLYTRLAGRLGCDQVYLLENLRADDEAATSAQIGYGRLLLISVYEDLVAIEGESSIISAIVAQEFPEGQVHDGRLTLRGEATDPWEILRRTQRLFRVSGMDEQRFSFGFFGYMGYESVHFIEQLPWNGQATDECPIMALGIYAHTVRFSAGAITATHIVSSSDFCDLPPIEDLNEEGSAPAAPVIDTPGPSLVRFSIDERRYTVGAEKALHHISIGDIYQVQLGHSITIESDIAPVEVYQRLRARCASPYMYLAYIGGRCLIGASPETFITVKDGLVAMRPLAGTAPRGNTVERDKFLCDELLSNPKERAEHIMLVDLCRNDLSRICQPESLVVTQLMALEKHSHVTHLVSHVCARPIEKIDVYDMIKATFPAGTMSGAPKIRAMEIIAEIESTRRNVYAGAVGLIDFGGFADLALCIRTATYDGREYTIRASAGVVADSVPSLEWRETLHKMGSTFWAITGEELQ